MKIPTYLILVLSLGLSTFAFAVDYETEIHPILKNHCGKCHMDGEAKGKVALDKNKIAKEMDGGSIVPGDVKKSDLHWTMTLSPDDDSAMPPKGRRVPKEEIDLIAKWIEEGASIKSSGAAAPTADTGGEEMTDSGMADGAMTDSMTSTPAPAAAGPKPYKGVFKNYEGIQVSATLVRMEGDWAVLVLPDSKEYKYPVAMFDTGTQEVVKKFQSGNLE